jgi:hypothetical protein
VASIVCWEGSRGNVANFALRGGSWWGLGAISCWRSDGGISIARGGSGCAVRTQLEGGCSRIARSGLRAGSVTGGGASQTRVRRRRVSHIGGSGEHRAFGVPMMGTARCGHLWARVLKALSLLRFFVAKDQEMTCRHAQRLKVLKKIARSGRPVTLKAATRHEPRPQQPHPKQSSYPPLSASKALSRGCLRLTDIAIIPDHRVINGIQPAWIATLLLTPGQRHRHRVVTAFGPRPCT